MACYHPMVGIPKVRNIYFPAGSNVAYCDPPKDGKKRVVPWIDGLDFSVPYAICPSTGESFYYAKIPCGQCIGCRLDEAKNKANRCVMEQIGIEKSDEILTKTSYFVTLTYNDESLPHNYGFLPAQISSMKQYEEMKPLQLDANGTLRYNDFQEFNKRLKSDIAYHQGKDIAEELRFLVAGEYGPTTQRPHYHAIFFSLNIPDLKEYKRNKQGDMLYTSEWLEKLWSHGFVVIGEFSWKTAAYTARYVVKKHKGKDADWYSNHHVEPEFSKCSLKPGIGAIFYNLYRDDIYQHDSIVLKDGLRVKPPRYFDKLLEKDNPKLLSQVKLKRVENATDQAYVDRMLNEVYRFSETDYFGIQEHTKTQQVKSLVRDIF